MDFDFLHYELFYGNSYLDFFTFFGVFFGVIFLAFLIKIIYRKKIQSFVSKSSTRIDDIIFSGIESFLKFGSIFLAFFLGKNFLAFPESFDFFAEKILNVLLIFIFLVIFQGILRRLISYHFESKTNKSEKYFSSLLKNIASIGLWGIGISIILSELGYNISTLVAGLGISGLAVALAVQPILASIFASFSIYLEKPFKVGEIVKIGSYTGTVRELGIRTVRLKTFFGTEVILPNTDVASSDIENLSARKNFRTDLTLGLVYETPTKKVKEAMQILREIIENHEKTTDDIRILFKEFADFSLNISLTYFIYEEDYYQRLKIESEINLEIKERFEKAGLDFAYPTSVNYIKK